MRNFYVYLTGIVLLASGAEIVSKISDDAAAPQVKWLAKKENPSDRKKQERVPFARTQKKTGTKALLAPGISATNTYAITNNTGPAGASAGDELEYTVVITNSGPDPANGTTFTETIDVNTTLVAGSVKASPIAQNDSYSTIGNVTIDIPAGQGLLANDVSPAGTALSVSSASNFTTANGGAVTIAAATGAFTYQPAAGYIGTDTFTYDIQNGSGMTSTATVSITIGNGANNAIWFINTSAPGGGNGTLASPFNTMTAFQNINDGGVNRPKDGHVIFLYSGNYNGNITLRNNQKLFGQGAAESLLALTGFPAPSGTNLLPATGGARPVLTSSSGDVLNATGTATIRGINIGNSAGAKIAGTGAGTLTTSHISLTGTGTALNLSGKVLAASFDEVSSSIGSGVSPVKITSGSGNLTISSGTLTASGLPALDVAGTGGGIALAVTLNAVNANGGNKGMILSNTTGTFQVTGAGTTPGSGGTIQNIAQRGIELLNATNITLKNINLSNANTVDGITPTNQDNSNANAAVHAFNVNGLTMDRIAISGTVAQEGINLRNSSNFNFTNGSIGSSGQTSEEGCIYAINTGGTNSIVNSTFTDPGGRAAYFSNTNTNMALLTVDNSTFQDASNSGLQFFGYGTSDMKLKVQNNSKFLRNSTVGVYVGANENAQMQADIKNSSVDVGNGVGRVFDMAAAGSSTLKFNILSNTGNFFGGIGLNMFAYQNGYLEGNVTGNTLINKTGSSGVSAIVHSAEGVGARGTFLIQNNTLTSVDSPGIAVTTTSTSGAQSNMNVKNNNITVTDSGSGDIYFGMDMVTTGAIGNNSKLCTNVTSNTVSKPAAITAYRTRSGTSTTTILVQGTGGTIVDVWNNGGNTPAGSAVQSGSANPYLFGQTCAVPNVGTLREGIIEEPSLENIAAMEAPVQEAPKAATTIPSSGPEKEAVSETAAATAPNPARTEAAQAGETVTVNGTGSGFTLPAGKNTTIKFRVTINNNIPASVCQLSTQGTVSGSNFASVLTDDPNTPGTNNPTITPVVSTPVITFCPGNQTFSPDAGTCTSTQTFAATADACPAATITYTVDGNPITFPYAFPAGTTTVLVTASNGIGTAPTCSFTVTVTPTPAPPITDEPDAQTICAGASASFTVATSQSGATYQWQKKPSGGSFADITTAENPTADDPTLTLTNVPATDNLAEYRCIVSNPCNDSTSASAVLTVNQITGSTLTGSATVDQGAPAPLVTFGATGGTLPYIFTYKVNNGSNQTVSTTGVNTTATVSQSTAAIGTFTYELVTVTDAQGCTLTPSPSQTATITVSNNLSATISGSTDACENETEPVITFTAVNGVAPFTFTYQINGGPDQQVTTTGSNTSATVNVPTAATGSFVYTLTQVSGAGGASTPVSGQTATVTVNAKPTIALTGAEYQCDYSTDPQTYTVFFTATPGAVITTDKGTVNGNTVVGVPSKQTATIVATLNNCTDTLTAYKDCSLPVTLIDFSGEKVENTVSLKWRTAEEMNSDHFEVQRSADGKKWRTIGTEKSHGESYTVVNYTFVDKNPGQGDNFYRLKMVDTDKTFAYSKIINVRYGEDALKSEFYPNPVSDVLNLKSTDWNQVKSVEMHSMTGLSVYKSGNTASKSIDVKNLPVGMYILTITHKNGGVVNRKVLINR